MAITKRKTVINFPDLSHYGYCIYQELGANRFGGRATYLAEACDRKCDVVIKQFQFAQHQSDWSQYDAIQREITVLRDLQHPGIPKYLDSFQISDGFCIVQEYKAAEPLSTSRSFSAEDLKTIATRILEILVYLQNRIPPIIHRDLKPDNILVDRALNVFLVDFGFARVGQGEVGVSSVVKGTLGFMPPEQLFNRQLTEASDLYGLGMTLICLLTHTKTDDIGSLVDISYKVKFKHLVPRLNFHWVKWLERMTEPRIGDRFSSAWEAFKAIPTSPLHPPEVQLSCATLQLQAEQLNQTLSACIEVSNAVPDITLTGAWEIQKHPNDPPAQAAEHAWISIDPAKFQGNKVQCRIDINTRCLMAATTYSRTLVLHSNAFPQTYSVPIQVRTANIPVRAAKISLYPMLVLFTATLLASRLLLWLTLPASLDAESTGTVGLGLALGALAGLQVAAWTLKQETTEAGEQLTLIATACLGLPTLVTVWLFLESLSGAWKTLLLGSAPGILGGWLLGLGMGLTVESMIKKSVSKASAIALVLLTSLFSVALALGITTEFSQAPTLFIIKVAAIALASLVVNTYLNNAKRVTNYRKLERNRVHP